MNTQSVIVEKTYNVQPQKIWNALTDVDEMRKWYFDVSDFRPEPGFNFSFTGGTEHKQYLHLCEVKEAIPNRVISYSWRYEGEPGDTLVKFELIPEGSETKLRVTHTGFETFTSGNPDLAKENFQAGWTDILNTSLSNYLEQTN